MNRIAPTIHDRLETIQAHELSRGARICAWCGRFLGTTELGGRTSHGICAGCADKLDRELARRGAELDG